MSSISPSFPLSSSFPLFSFSLSQLEAKVIVGADHIFDPKYEPLLKGKKIGVITNYTAINKEGIPTYKLLKANAKKKGYTLVAIFAPEHGLTGTSHAGTTDKDHKDTDGTPIYSLHGKTKRPTKEMLKSIDTLIFDIQDIGSRSYTYMSTLFYAMEEAAKEKINVIVLDRPNPMNGITIDGPVLKEQWRSFVGYINTPYCHGMTVGELAKYFNEEYKIGCNLKVIPMSGWNREMTFEETGLLWVPTSPNIPEATSPWYYPTTGLIGELGIVNIGVGYTLPFKIIGAPWIDAELLAKRLNEQKFPGVTFQPFHFQPFFGKFAKEECHGVMIVITDTKKFRPVSTQYLIIGTLKSTYPKMFQQALASVKNREEMFNKVNGTDEVYRLLTHEPFVVWKLQDLHSLEREQFAEKRKKYLIASYSKAGGAKANGLKASGLKSSGVKSGSLKADGLKVN